jgi:hypothetical protein
MIIISTPRVRAQHTQAHLQLVGVHVEELSGPLISCSMTDKVHTSQARLAAAGHKHQHRLGRRVNLQLSKGAVFGASPQLASYRYTSRQVLTHNAWLSAFSTLFKQHCCLHDPL